MPREFDATNTSSTALWSDDGYQVFGYELEINGLSVSRVKQILRDNNLPIVGLKLMRLMLLMLK